MTTLSEIKQRIAKALIELQAAINEWDVADKRLITKAEQVTNTHMKQQYKARAVVAPVAKKPSRIHHDRGEHVTEAHRVKAIEWLKKAGEPQSMTRIMKECDIPEGSGASIFNHTAFE